MDFFKVYLPSNACQDSFPSNTPADYTTRFDKPIALDGKWEVGVERIAYSSHINDKKERATIDFNVTAKKPVTVNEISTFKFKTTANGKWNGYEGVGPRQFSKDSTHVDSILESLNLMGYDMLTPIFRERGHRIFVFTLNEDGHVVYRCYDHNFSLCLTPRMAQVLGFSYKNYFCGDVTVTAPHAVRVNEPLARSDYFLYYMSTSAQENFKRITLKEPGEVFDGRKETFIKLWNEKFHNIANIQPEFVNNKLVLHCFESELGYVLSFDITKTFNYYSSVRFGRSEEWSNGNVHLDQDHTNSHWYVDLYSTKMDMTTINGRYYLSLKVYPWHHKSVTKLLRYINNQSRILLRRHLKQSYDNRKHYFHLSLEETNHCTLRKGYGLMVFFSKNLSYLLSFPDVAILNSISYGVREVQSLGKHSRQLHLLSNIIQPTAYGKHQRHILCDFLHKASTQRIIEKRFHPISYHPLPRNIIDRINLQLVDDDYLPIVIEDVKTIVTLYFRKASEKTSM